MSDTNAKPPTAHEADLISEELALTFLLNAEAIEAQLAPPPISAADTASLKAALDGLPSQDLPSVLGGVAGILVTATPGLAALFEQSRARGEVRGLLVTDPAVISSLVTYLLQNPFLIPIVAASLRLLGDNRIKIGKIEVRTGSILKDLAGLLHGKK